MNKERLSVLAGYLRNSVENQPLGWDFNNIIVHRPINIVHCDVQHLNKCGAAGCALGHLPIAFPDDWFYSAVGGHLILNLKGCERIGVFNKAMAWFDLTGEEIGSLFSLQNYRYTLADGTKISGYEVRPWHVAERIEQFIAG